MSLDLLRSYGASRMADYAPQQPLLNPPSEDGSSDERAVLDYEVDLSEWTAFSVTAGSIRSWRDWSERPVRFIDGKDRGRTVAWLRAPSGYPIAVHLSEIGAIAVRTDQRQCRRETTLVDRVVAMVIDPFPWDEVESFAAALPEHGLRLLPAEAPDISLLNDLEAMRKAAQNRTMTEMGSLEEAVLAQGPGVPTIIDGRLEPRAGGFDVTTPVAGVIKEHSKNYLHAGGLRMLYDLRPGERTPVFAIQGEKVRLPVATWYVRLTGANRAMPTWGTIRIEVPLRWFGTLDTTERFQYVTALSRLLCEYRCRNPRYGRAPVSLHPIVRAEELLGALFTSSGALSSHFYRINSL